MSIRSTIRCQGKVGAEYVHYSQHWKSRRRTRSPRKRVWASGWLTGVHLEQFRMRDKGSPTYVTVLLPYNENANGN